MQHLKQGVAQIINISYSVNIQHINAINCRCCAYIIRILLKGNLIARNCTLNTFASSSTYDINVPLYARHCFLDNVSKCICNFSRSAHRLTSHKANGSTASTTCTRKIICVNHASQHLYFLAIQFGLLCKYIIMPASVKCHARICANTGHSTHITGVGNAQTLHIMTYRLLYLCNAVARRYALQICICFINIFLRDKQNPVGNVIKCNNLHYKPSAKLSSAI
nr:MAG TPA: hypothetical protein [Caudoviricetes sp.]